MISRRYERGFALITSNLPFDEWTETFGSERADQRALRPPDQLRQHLGDDTGESYRLGQCKAGQAPLNVECH